MERKQSIARFPFPALIQIVLFNGYEKNKQRLELFRWIMSWYDLFEVYTQGDQNNWKIVLERELESTYFSYQKQELRKHLMLLQREQVYLW